MKIINDIRLEKEPENLHFNDIFLGKPFQFYCDEEVYLRSGVDSYIRLRDGEISYHFGNLPVFALECELRIIKRTSVK